MSYLYKRSNRLWHLLIKHRLTHKVWSPLVEWTRLRHLRFRDRLADRAAAGAAGECPLRTPPLPPSVVTAGV